MLPLVATVLNISLLATTARRRPWQRQQRLFIWFLIVAILWSLTDFVYYSDFSPQYSLALGKLSIVMFAWMAVQLHSLTSSFFPSEQGRWLPFAYLSLAAVIVLATLSYVPEQAAAGGSQPYPAYGSSIVFAALILLLTLVARNAHVFWRRLRISDSPTTHNQNTSLLLGILVLTVFALATLIPWGRQFPVVHLGSTINAFILSYAVIRHQSVDITVVLRRGLAWIGLGVIGIACYWLLLTLLHRVLDLEFDATVASASAVIAVVVAVVVHKLRDSLFVTVGKAFQGPGYDYRQRLYDVANHIPNASSLKEQGGELLMLVTRAIGCKTAGLLFPESHGNDFTAQVIVPGRQENPLHSLRLRGDSPILEYLGQERRPLTRENLRNRYEFRNLSEPEKEEIKSSEAELFVPLIGRDSLVAILVLGKKQSGMFTLEDSTLLEDATNRVAVSMEKEYLRQQFKEREKELSVINRASVIMTSSLDIQKIYDRFIQELKAIVDVSWAAIVLIDDNELHFLALYSEIGSAWQVGDRLPIKDTATEWAAAHRKTMIESDLAQENRFPTGKYHLRQGVRSIAYLPLIAKDEVIGSLVVASRYPDAYSQRHLNLLERLASQIGMPIHNSRLYARAEQRARIDEVTGLLNRRSLDEVISSEIGRHSRYGGVFSLVILDLDTFKTYNDYYGHLAGDSLLKQIGATMKGALRSADQTFRYGGDEFAILLPQTTIEPAFKIAERIRKRVASQVPAGQARVTASLGLASWPADGVRPNEIIAAADTALYHAKRRGGNQSYHGLEAMLVSDGATTGNGSREDGQALGTILALAATVDDRDHYCGIHSRKVSEYAVALAEALNLTPLETGRLANCALVHDIGKIGVSDDIINKKGKLTAEESEAVKTHPRLGVTIASYARELTSCGTGILHHHERFDGSGYPMGLKGEDIPLQARIMAIADAFAAMISDRPYREALSYEEALEEMKRGAGTQFDPNLVEVFLSVLQDYPATAIGESMKS